MNYLFAFHLSLITFILFCPPENGGSSTFDLQPPTAQRLPIAPLSRLHKGVPEIEKLSRQI
jgi:hypothetical protein